MSNVSYLDIQWYYGFLNKDRFGKTLKVADFEKMYHVKGSSVFYPICRLNYRIQIKINNCNYTLFNCNIYILYIVYILYIIPVYWYKLWCTQVIQPN